VKESDPVATFDIMQEVESVVDRAALREADRLLACGCHSCHLKARRIADDFLYGLADRDIQEFNHYMNGGGDEGE
jgi:hypothetical protein